MATLDLAQIQHRRDTAANWVVANPVLASGEIGIETDTHLEKLGDGVTLWNSLGYMPEQLAKQITSATSKTTPVDADEIPLADSTASFGLKKLTWANLKATLKAYFDTLYEATGLSILKSLLTTTGDMIYASSANTPARLPKGNTGDVMTQGATIPGWAAPAASGATVDTYRKTSAQTITSSTVLTDDTVLQFAVAANEVWMFELVLYVTCPAGGANIRVAMTDATATSVKWGFSGSGYYSTAGSFAVTRDQTGGVYQAHYVDNASIPIRISGVVDQGATLGTLKLQWCQDTSSANGVSVNAGSYMVAVKGA